MSTGGEITDAAHWNRYWEARVEGLPLVARRVTDGLQVDAILDVVDRFLPEGMGGDVLEIGGAPGKYLAYVHARTGCSCAILDFSPFGCALARENFDKLGVPLTIYERDLSDPGLGRHFDVVFSLGLIEHFDDLTSVVSAHARLVLPGGLLMLGMPNFLGVNGWVAARLGPARVGKHNLATMKFEAWDRFERELGLERLFRAPIGGFEPGVFAVFEEDVPLRWLLLKYAAESARRLLSHHGTLLRRFNHPAISGYLMGVWRVP